MIVAPRHYYITVKIATLVKFSGGKQFLMIHSIILQLILQRIFKSDMNLAYGTALLLVLLKNVMEKL